MQKKIIALCVLLTSVTYVSADYPATQGVQADSHHHKHHHQPDRITDEADRNRLQVLDQEDKDGYYYTNLAKFGFAVGVVGVVIGSLASEQKINNVTIGSAVLAAGSGIGGLVIGQRETQRGILRAQERAEILKRRQRNH